MQTTLDQCKTVIDVVEYINTASNPARAAARYADNQFDLDFISDEGAEFNYSVAFGLVQSYAHAHGDCVQKKLEWLEEIAFECYHLQDDDEMTVEAYFEAQVNKGHLIPVE